MPDLPSGSDMGRVADATHEHTRYNLLKSQIVEASKLGLRGVAVDGTLTKEDEEYLLEQGYDILNYVSQQSPPIMGDRLVVLW